MVTLTADTSRVTNQTVLTLARAGLTVAYILARDDCSISSATGILVRDAVIDIPDMLRTTMDTFIGTVRDDDNYMFNVCTHSEHQARTIKILQSLCVRHKIVETYRNQHASKFSKMENGMMREWQH
jgi:hypothetical protein